MSKKEDKPNAKCHRCNYEWATASKMLFVTCPSCHTKVKVNREDNSEKDE